MDIISFRQGEVKRRIKHGKTCSSHLVWYLRTRSFTIEITYRVNVPIHTLLFYNETNLHVLKLILLENFISNVNRGLRILLCSFT